MIALINRNSYLENNPESAIEPVLGPKSFTLHPNYPNPFNPLTRISLQLTTNSEIELSIYDVNGRKIETLMSGFKAAGNYMVEWDASSQSSGIYFYRLNVNERVETKKMLLVK